MGMWVQVLMKDMPYVGSLWCSKQAGTVNKMGLVLTPSLLFVEPKDWEGGGKGSELCFILPKAGKEAPGVVVLWERKPCKIKH